MNKTGRTKKITCYNCKKKSEAKELETLKEIRTSKGWKNRKIKTWTAKRFRTRSENLWLCDACDRNRCKNCGMILSNKRQCRCKNKHGVFYPEHPEFCKECWDDLAS